MKFVGLIESSHPQWDSRPGYLALTEDGHVFLGRWVGSGAPDEWHLHWDDFGKIETQCECSMGD